MSGIVCNVSMIEDLTVDIRLCSNLNYGVSLDRLRSLPTVRVEEVEGKGRAVILMKERRSKIEIWSGGSVAIHLQPYENLLEPHCLVMHALVDNDGARASYHLTKIEVKGTTGARLLLADAIDRHTGQESFHWHNQIRIRSWVHEVLDTSLRLFSRPPEWPLGDLLQLGATLRVEEKPQIQLSGRADEGFFEAIYHDGEFAFYVWDGEEFKVLSEVHEGEITIKPPSSLPRRGRQLL